MSLDLSGFIHSAQTSEGIYRLSDTLERRKYREDQLNLQREGKKNAATNFLSNYLDTKDYYTGTPHDPEIVNRINGLLQQGADLANKGADSSTLMMALSPGVSKLNEYYTKAKAISEQKKEALSILKNQKGIDSNKFSSEFDDEAFMETDPTTGAKKVKDLSLIDPNTNYADKVLKGRNVYTNEAFDDFVSKSGKNTMVEDISVYNKNRAMRRTKAEMTMPAFMMSEKDARGAHIGFVPQYDIATDDSQPILHDFLTAEGNRETAPVRMVTNEVFQSLPSMSKAYLRQEALKYAKQNNIDAGSPQVENFARALAYDELKRSAKQFSTMKELSVEKAAPIKIYTGGANNKPIELRDIYKEVNGLAGSDADGKVKLPDLTPEAQGIILKYANELKGFGGDLKMSQDDVYVKKTSNGDLNIIDVKTGKPITKIPYESLNLPANPGLKAKQEVLKKAKEQSTSKTFPLPSGKPKTVSQGGYTYTWDENSGTYK